MRVAMIATSFPKYPGEMTAPFIEEIAASVAARGIEVHLVLPAHPELRRGPLARGIHLHPYRYAPHSRLQVWGYAEGMHNDVRTRTAAWIVSPLALAAGWLALERLASRQRFDIIHAHWVIPNGVPAWLSAIHLRLPLVVSLHGSDVSVAERTLPTALLSRQVLRTARAITAPSTDLTTRAAALGAPPARLHVLPYCVDAQAFQPAAALREAVRTRWSWATDAQVLFAVGRMVEKKGFIYLIRALALLRLRHPQVRLVLGGYGPGEQALRAEVAALSLEDWVDFPGPIQHPDINGFLNAADVFVLPSVRDRSGNVDGLPNTLLEAMGAGRPIVASRIAGVPGVIEDGVQGLLVAPGSPEALASALDRLLADPDVAAALGASARQRVDHELTWAHYAARLERLYTGEDYRA